METSGFSLNIIVKHIPTDIVVNLNDDDFFNYASFFWNFFNLEEDHIFRGGCNNLAFQNMDINNAQSGWQRTGQGNPWFRIVNPTEKEANEIIAIKEDFDKEEEYILKMLKQNLIPYENILSPYTSLQITKNTKVIHKVNTVRQFPDGSGDINFFERYGWKLQRDPYHPLVDYSTLFLGPLSGQQIHLDFEKATDPDEFEVEEE